MARSPRRSRSWSSSTFTQSARPRLAMTDSCHSSSRVQVAEGNRNVAGMGSATPWARAAEVAAARTSDESTPPENATTAGGRVTAGSTASSSAAQVSAGRDVGTRRERSTDPRGIPGEQVGDARTTTGHPLELFLDACDTKSPRGTPRALLGAGRQRPLPPKPSQSPGRRRPPSALPRFRRPRSPAPRTSHATPGRPECPAHSRNPCPVT